MTGEKRRLKWVGSSQKDANKFPARARSEIAVALDHVCAGAPHPAIKIWKGMGGGVYAINIRAAAGAYRVVYVARLESAVYVPHAFQKKSRKGIATPGQDLDLIKKRLRAAQSDDRKGRKHA